ncbi:MAG TPA: hypothetical protein VET84_07010 [Stellaceae bacterium]|nr:hypothetical protein [Stellaceae bacterium]
MKGHDWYDITTIIILAITLSALIVYTGLTAYQACIARDTARRQLRAYVGLQRLELELPSLNDPNYKPMKDEPGAVFTDFQVTFIKNFGATPAFNVSIFTNCTAIPFLGKLPDGFNYPIPPDRPSVLGITSRQTLYPGQEVVSRVRILDVNNFKQAIAKSKSLYLWGTINYTDIYDRRWSSYFCFVYEPWRPAGSRWIPYEEHNGEKQMN